MANKSKLYVSLASVLSLTLASQFVYSPVFAEGPVDIEIVEVVEDGSGGFKPWEDIVGGNARGELQRNSQGEKCWGSAGYGADVFNSVCDRYQWECGYASDQGF